MSSGNAQASGDIRGRWPSRCLYLLTAGAAYTSTIFFLICVILWVRSYWRGDNFMLKYDIKNQSEYRSDEGYFVLGSSIYRVLYLSSHRGNIGFGSIEGGGPSLKIQDASTSWKTYLGNPSQKQPWFVASMGNPSPRHPGFPPMFGVSMSYLFPSLATSVLPTWFLVRLHRRSVRRRRTELGLCLRCGYDLRANQGHVRSVGW
jgi:hypothetical protein